MEQPFIVGKPVSGKYFIGREVEIKKILAMLSGTSEGNINNVILLGLRRTGKSSILLNIKRILSKNKRIVPVILDAYGISTKDRFSKTLVNKVLQAYVEAAGDRSRRERVKKMLGQALDVAAKRVSEFEIDIAEYVRFQAKLREPKASEDELLEQALQYAEKLGKESNIRFVIMLDEFQDLLEWGDKFLKMFRRLVQGQKHVAYVLAGSMPTVMREMVYDTKSPFYKQLTEVSVGRLDEKSVSAFVQKRLKSVRISIDEGALDLVYSLSNGLPDYVQRLGLQMFLRSLESDKRQIKEDDVKRAYSDLVLQLDPDFNNLFGTFADMEKEILIALACGHDTYAAIAREIRKPQSSLPKTVMRLLRQNVVEKPREGRYRITDPIFADWLNQRYSLPNL